MELQVQKHRRAQAANPAHDFTASETNYFGFNIPEHGINAEVYLWAHPRFGVTAGGVFIYQGMKRQALAADYHNYFAYQPMPKSAGMHSAAHRKPLRDQITDQRSTPRFRMAPPRDEPLRAAL